MKDSRFILILLVFSCFLFLYKIGDMALTDPDESFYAETAKEMLSEGEWITPRIFGKPQFEKPVLYYWLIQLSYIAFGVGEFAARLPSVVFGILGILGVFLIARLIFSPKCAFLSALIMTTSALYVALARGCVTDMVLAVFILYSFFFFLKGWLLERKIFFYLSSAMIALAVLTKGPIGLFIPGAVLFIYISLIREWKEFFRKVPVVSSVFIFLLVCLPWYILVTKANGTSFINEFFGFQNITRFLHPEHRIGSSPVFYFPVVVGGLFPWSTFLIFGAWYLARRDRAFSAVKKPRTFLLTWFLVIFIFFSISRTKLVTYIFPLFPVLAITAGRFWQVFIEKGEEDESASKGMKWAYIIFLICALGGAIAVVFLIREEYPQGPAFMGAIAASVLFILGAIVSAFLFFTSRREASFFAIVISVAILIFPIVNQLLPTVELYESSKNITLRLNELSKPDESIAGESDHRRGIAFYSDRVDIEDIHSYHELKQYILRKDKVWGIIQLKHYNQLKSELKDKVLPPVYEIGGYVIITNKSYKE